MFVGTVVAYFNITVSQFGETGKYHEEHHTAGNCFKITLVPGLSTVEIKKNGGVIPPLPLRSIALGVLLGSVHGKLYFGFYLYLTDTTLDTYLWSNAFPLN